VQKKSRHKYAGFTLIEVLVSVVLSGMILTSAYGAFQGIMKSQVRLSGVINIQRNLFYLNEKLSILIHNGWTIDYEEYFNRRILGYNKSFNPEEVWTFSEESNYGNGENNGRPLLYLCGKDSNPVGKEDACLEANSVSIAPDQTNFTNTLIWKQMWYGQYREIGLNYGSLSGYPTPIKLPPIFPSTNMELNSAGISDLYLIKKLPSGTYERTYFRHVYIQDPSTALDKATCDPSSTTLTGCLGKIQMTRLISCDSLPAWGDGILDAWAKHPDFWGGTDPCSEIDWVNKIASATDNIIWADISSPEMNIIHAQFLPRPLKIPGRMSGVGEEAFSATVQIHMEVQLSERVLARGLLQESENKPRFLTTTFDLENS
jgi:prepilin-type N-terminal cleavage/methylation domain-containing protein